MSNYEGSPKIALPEGIIKFCSLLFRQTTLFGSLTNSTQILKCVLKIFFEKQKDLYQRVLPGGAMYDFENVHPLRSC